ncbi:hypothetical protein [Rubellicoccus peritrichatus]|uniref:SLA1 homology domain-containing protein n=1 Tax=Rubellicoccus peritrichatus TaxID=3080537 RepID=A0AAQ3LAQ5_9BACT|nr:hypothetical protein [Puniceicoccus sp. CR14]WOO40048.1 hypothetical protein RZN69_15600 [Puniceicoccus sp. CR14]
MKSYVIPSVLISSLIAAGGGFFAGRMSVQAFDEKLPAQQDQIEIKESELTPTHIEVVEETDIAIVIDPIPETDANDESSTKRFSERAAQPMQTLTDVQGRSITVEILEVDNQMVKIKKDDGREYSIPLKNLSEEDVAFCEYIREKNTKSPKPTKTSDIDWDAIFGS